MTFFEKFQRQCEIHDESPTHALDCAGLSKSAYTRWLRDPDKMPTAETITKLADYWNIDYYDLLPSKPESDPPPTTDTYNQLVMLIMMLNEDQQKQVFRYIQFQYRNELPVQVQKLRV